MGHENNETLERSISYDSGVLFTVIETVEEFLRKYDLVMEPQAKGALVVNSYEYLVKAPEGTDIEERLVETYASILRERTSVGLIGSAPRAMTRGEKIIFGSIIGLVVSVVVFVLLYIKVF